MPTTGHDAAQAQALLRAAIATADARLPEATGGRDSCSSVRDARRCALESVEDLEHAVDVGQELCEAAGPIAIALLDEGVSGEGVDDGRGGEAAPWIEGMHEAINDIVDTTCNARGHLAWLRIEARAAAGEGCACWQSPQALVEVATEALALCARLLDARDRVPECLWVDDMQGLQAAADDTLVWARTCVAQ